jgi:hypothetical protein
MSARFPSGSTLIAVMNAGRPRVQLSISSGNGRCWLRRYFDFPVDDPGTRVIIGFIEGREPRRSSRRRSAAAVGKPILLKPGAASGSARSAGAYGRAGGRRRGHRSGVPKARVIRAHDVDELTSWPCSQSEGGPIIAAWPHLRVGRREPDPRRRDCSHGGARACAATRGSAALPAHIQVANPLDMTATGLYEADLYRRRSAASRPIRRNGVVAGADMPPGMGEVQSRRYQDARAPSRRCRRDRQPLLLQQRLGRHGPGGAEISRRLRRALIARAKVSRRSRF